MESGFKETEIEEMKKKQAPLRVVIRDWKELEWLREDNKRLQESVESYSARVTILEKTLSIQGDELTNLRVQAAEYLRELNAAKKIIEDSLPTKEDLFNTVENKIKKMAFEEYLKEQTTNEGQRDDE